MTAVRDVLTEAPGRGIHLHFDGDHLVVTGDASEKFLVWAARHKAEILAELAGRVPYEDCALAALVRLCDEDRARLIEGRRPPYLARVRVLIWRKATNLSDALFDDAVRALLLRGRIRRVGDRYMPAGPTPVPPGYCVSCNGGGCRACDFYGCSEGDER